MQSEADSTVSSMKKGSFASDDDSEMTRQMCASVTNPNMVPVVNRYAFMADPPNETGPSTDRHAYRVRLSEWNVGCDRPIPLRLASADPILSDVRYWRCE